MATPVPAGAARRVWVSDMATNAPEAHKSPRDRIDGPIPEFDAWDRYTGYDYFRCRNCGREAMRRVDLEGCCDA
jgi:hypothetical protein